MDPLVVPVGIEPVDPPFADDAVVAPDTIAHVEAPVIPGATVDLIVASTATYRVDTTVAVQIVIPGAADDDVVTLVAVHQVGTAIAEDLVAARSRSP